MLNDRLDRLTDYPFQRLTDLLGGPADADCLNLSIGEPQHQPPAFVRTVLDENFHLWGKYPPVPGTPDFRAAVAGWLGRRYGLPAGFIDGDRHVLPAAGTREALYMIAQVVGSAHKRSLVLLPNPFYQVYAGAAVMAGFEPVFVPADKSTGFLPDYTALPAKVLDRVALAFYCSPANPQGAVADLEAWKTIIALARRYGFYLAADECYSEIYDTRPPAGILQACAALDRGVDNVVVFNSLSKRSSVPGLRSGFVAGDAKVIAAFSRLRSYGAAGTPLPVLAAAARLWRDEEHVEANRALYRRKMDIAASILGGRFGFRRPEGGFFLWLEVEDGETATRMLWNKARLRVLPGAYLAHTDRNGRNPGAGFIRLALVHDSETTATALTRLAETL